MVMKNRSRIDILAEILEAASNGGIRKTEFTYKVFINSEQLKEYLPTLLDRGLIKYDSKNSIYITTQKGFNLLKVYAQTDTTDLFIKKKRNRCSSISFLSTILALPSLFYVLVLLPICI